MSLVSEFVSRNWLFTVLIAAVGGLIKKVFDLHENNASLKAKVDVLEERNSRSISEIASLNEQKAVLQSTLQGKFSEEAILCKYEFNRIGVAVNKENKRFYCPACLQNLPRKEVVLSDGGDAHTYLRCPIVSTHTYEKSPDGRRQLPPYGLTDNPY